MKKQIEQRHEKAWCECCEKQTMFVTHADFPHRWHCTNRGCYNWVLKLKEK